MTAIDDKYASLGGGGGVLGAPTGTESPCPDLVGRFRHFQHGSIYWTPGTGAHEVHGAIHDLWASLGWEQSPVGYPTSDEHDPDHAGHGPPGTARVSHFQHGSIYWDPGRGAYEVFPRPEFHDLPAAKVGRWEVAPWTSGVVGMHAALLGDDRALFLGYLEPMDHANPGPIPADDGDSAVIDLRAGARHDPAYAGPFPRLPNIFCSGHAWLPDGRLLIGGGDREAQERVRALHVYEPDAAGGTWRHVGQTAAGRWYTTCTTLPDGRVVLVGGEKRIADADTRNTAFEVFDPHLGGVGNEIPQPALLGGGPWINYPFVYVLPDHRLLVHGGTQTTFYDLPSFAFDGTVVEAVARTDRNSRTYGVEGTSVLLPLRPDSDPPYAARILAVAGGGAPSAGIRTPATDTCELLDTAASPPRWRSAAPLHHARVMPDAVLLPDGTVLVMSGSARGQADNGANPVWEAELYHPDTDTWTDVAATSVPRLYHSTALLLRDGRVLTAGSDSIWNPEPFHRPELRVELYSPPYLSAGPRPVVTAAPAVVRPGGPPLLVISPEAGSVDAVVLMRCGAVTHSFNADQRLVGLTITAVDGPLLTVEAPPDGYVAPPGPYLLFLLRDGVPSEGRHVTVEVAGTHDRRAAVAGVSRRPGHLDLFVVDGDGLARSAAWEPGFPDGWHGWWEVAGGRAFPPGAPVHAVCRDVDKIDVFAVDDEGEIVTAAWAAAEPGGWHGWFGVAGGHAPPGAAVTAVSRRADLLDLFVVGRDGRVMTAAWSPGAPWSSWSVVGDGRFVPGTPVHAVSRSVDKLDLFAVDEAGVVRTASWEPGFAGWHAWSEVAGGRALPGSPVTAVARSADHLDVFVTGADGQVHTAAWQPGFEGWLGWWTIQPGHRFVPGAPVHAVSRSTDHLDVFAADVDGRVVTAAWEPAVAEGWRGWWVVADGHTAPGAPVTGVSRGTDMLDVFAVDAEGRVATSGWGPGRGPAWTPWAAIGG